MKELTVLGAGIAGLNLIQKLRQIDPSFKITLIDKNPYSFDKKELISNFSLDNVIETKLWAEDLNVEFIQGHLERISAKRKKIYFKERETKEFDCLVVATGLASKKIPIKGEHREGFFYLSAISPFKLKSLLKISQEVTVYISTILGLRLAVALIVLGKEVKVLSSNLDFLSQDKERVIDFLKENNLPFYSNVSIEEAIGERAIKAVKISPLKVFSSQLVFIDSGFLPNRDFFEEEIQLKNTFFTDYEGLYFLGDVNRENLENDFFYLFNHQEAKEQASIFADFLLEGKVPEFVRRQVEDSKKREIIEDLMKPRLMERSEHK